MKILHVIRWRNQNFNGVMNVVPLYVKYQNNLENVFLFNDGNEIKNSDSFNINKNCKKSFSQTINKLKPDIVIFHEVYVFNHIICAKICKKNNIPYIVVPHGSLTRQAQNIKKIKKIGGNLVFFKPFIRNAASIHFLSYGEQNNSLYANNFFISPNGVTIEKDFNKKISIEKKLIL